MDQALCDWVIVRLSDLKNRPMAKSLNSLLAVQLNNQLLVYGQLNIFALGQSEHTRRVLVAIHFQPVRHRTVAGEFLGQFEHRELLAALANGDLVSGADFERRNVDLLAVDGDVPMAHQLARLTPRLRKTETEHYVVETPL